MRCYLNTALIYAVLAMAGGVFYPEFTKWNGFTEKTVLGVIHTHYFVLGMMFFLILLFMEKNFSFTGKENRTDFNFLPCWTKSYGCDVFCKRNRTSLKSGAFIGA